MKKLRLGLLSATLCMAVMNVHAQTLDEVVAKHIEAIGGKEKLQSLKTVRMEGTLTIPNGTEVSITITRAHMIGQRVDIAVMGMNGYKIATPEKGWNFLPFQGQTAPEPMSDDEFKATVTQFDLQGTFVDPKDKGTQLELQGKETINGAEANKIKATFKSGIVTTYYIDSKTNYIIKTSGNRKVNGADMEIETTYFDFKTTPEGYIFPYKTSGTNGETSFDKIEVNKAVDPKLFTAE